MKAIRNHSAWLALFYGLVIALTIAFILLHTWGWGGRLNWISDPISIYTSSAPGKNFGTFCMLLLGIIYLFLALALSLKVHSLSGSVAFLALGVAGILLFFVARYPYPGPSPAKSIWQTLRDKIVGPSSSETQDEDMKMTHNDMILSSTVCLVVSQCSLIVALWKDRRYGRLARNTLLLVPVVALLFAGAFRSPDYQGVYQRLAFIVVLTWLVQVANAFLHGNSVSQQQALRSQMTAGE